VGNADVITLEQIGNADVITGDQVFKGNDLLLHLQRGNRYVQLVPTGNSTGNYYNTGKTVIAHGKVKR
jgi:hypothetical protein